MALDTEQTLHPRSLSDSFHRKVELQSQQDLFYLQSNLLALAREKLDRDLPPAVSQPQQPRKTTVISLDGAKPASEPLQDVPNRGEARNVEEDYPLRAAVRTYIDNYISRIYASAAPSITVNGLDATALPPTTLSTKHPSPVVPTDAMEPAGEKEGVDFEYEAYDTRLQLRVADMYREVENLTVQVGQLRRDAPKQGAAAWARLIAETIEQEDTEAEKELHALREEAVRRGQEAALQLKPLPDGWFEDRKTLFQMGRNELAALAGLANDARTDTEPMPEVPSLTETVGRVQRAKTVAMEFD
jgi:kinetochor protein Mis14/NSL1